MQCFIAKVKLLGFIFVGFSKFLFFENTQNNFSSTNCLYNL